mmetsp:Transcript_1624/g.2256  ORF Transcript_1624/g.2256 Transcript_1624/m.2256 type:complete len:472 (-) Transcript_1624:24-1439(-)
MIRQKFLQMHDIKSKDSDFHFVRNLLSTLQIFSTSNFIDFIMSELMDAFTSTLSDSAINSYIDLLIEQIDTNRNGLISAREFYDFLWKPPEVRELGFLIKAVRGAIIGSMVEFGGVLSSNSSEIVIYDSFAEFAKRRNIHVSKLPSLNGRKINARRLRAVVQSLDILNNLELEMVVQTMDMNLDGFISCSELKKWLFPPSSQDFLRDQREKNTHSEKTPLQESVKNGDVEGEYEEVCRLFKEILLASCENEASRKSKTRAVFSMLDKDKSGRLSAFEMKQFLREFFLELGEEDEDEVDIFHSRLMEQIDRDGNGFIDLEELTAFLWPTKNSSSTNTTSSSSKPTPSNSSSVHSKVAPSNRDSDLAVQLATEKVLRLANVHSSDSDALLVERFVSFLKSFRCNRGFICCKRGNLFEAKAIQRALLAVYVEELPQQALNRKEVDRIMVILDQNNDKVVSVKELRGWLFGPKKR